MLDEGRRHAGIIFIPGALSRDERELLAAIIAGFMGGADFRQMKNIVIYLAHDGLHMTNGERDELLYSYHQMRQDLDLAP